MPRVARINIEVVKIMCCLIKHFKDTAFKLRTRALDILNKDFFISQISEMLMSSLQFQIDELIRGMFVLI